MPDDIPGSSHTCRFPFFPDLPWRRTWQLVLLMRATPCGTLTARSDGIALVVFFLEFASLLVLPSFRPSYVWTVMELLLLASSYMLRPRGGHVTSVYKWFYWTMSSSDCPSLGPYTASSFAAYSCMPHCSSKCTRLFLSDLNPLY